MAALIFLLLNLAASLFKSKGRSQCFVSAKCLDFVHAATRFRKSRHARLAQSTRAEKLRRHDGVAIDFNSAEKPKPARRLMRRRACASGRRRSQGGGRSPLWKGPSGGLWRGAVRTAPATPPPAVFG